MTIMKQRVNEMNDVQYKEDCFCNVQWTYGQKKECVLQRYNVYIFDNFLEYISTPVPYIFDINCFLFLYIHNHNATSSISMHIFIDFVNLIYTVINNNFKSVPTNDPLPPYPPP